MYIGDFINVVKKMRQAQVARRRGNRAAAVQAWKYEQEVDRGLAEGVTVVEAMPPKILLPAPQIMNSEDLNEANIE